jgi:hypothetical protein
MSTIGTLPISSLELILRIGCFGIFFGHGYIAAFKLEFSAWVKFMLAGGFTTKEANIVMPIIGYKDVSLALLTLLCPCELALVWMTAWAFSTALMRPFSGGLIWGFVERAGNFCCPLALLHVLATESLGAKAARRGGAVIGTAAYDALSLSGTDFEDRLRLVSGVVVATWLVVGLLKNRSLLDAAKPAKPAAYMPPHRRRPASPGPRKSPRRAKSPAPTRA